MRAVCRRPKAAISRIGKIASRRCSGRPISATTSTGRCSSRTAATLISPATSPITNPTGETDTIRIGKISTQTATYIVGIRGTTVAGGVSVMVDANNRLGTVTSSARYKENIQPMDKASEAILSLQPVTFHYKHELDPDRIPQFGLVAEQVEKVNPDLVVRDEQGKPYSVRYEAVNAMLLNEFLKAHRKVQQLDTTVAQQQKEIETLREALNRQAAQIQTVADQVAVSRTGPRVVVNE